MELFSKDFEYRAVQRLVPFSMLLWFFAFFFIGCSTFSTFKAKSDWGDQKIIIDGKSDDWSGMLSYVQGYNVSVGFRNDQDNLFICLIAEDLVTRNQIMRQGLTVWFDPKGGQEKIIGIKFPIGMQSADRPRPGEPEKQNETFDEDPGEYLTELEIIGPEKDQRKKMERGEAKGIEIHAQVSSGMLVYELRIPLARSEQSIYAVGSSRGKIVGVGFETAELDRSEMPGRPSPGRPGGGGMPGGGRPPMGGSRGRGGMEGFGTKPDLPKPLKIWAILQLASEKNNPVSAKLTSL
jgi:hypothetical protein